MTKSNPITFSPKSGLIFLSVFLFLLSAPLFSQNDSRYDSGLNLPFNEKAGDLNPQTGSVTVQATDVSLPGRAGMDFSFGRVWTTAQSNVFAMSQDPVTNLNRLSTDTVESRTRLGAGWTSTVPMIYNDESSGSLVQYLFINGSAYELDQTGMAVKNAQKSNILWYDYLDKRVYHDSGIAYGDRAGFSTSELAHFGVTDTATARSRYVLIFQDNSKYWFRPDGKVMMQEDRTGLNKIWYYYDSISRLRLVVDTIGRKIRFTYDGAGNLASVSWDVTTWEKDSGDTRTQRTATRTVRYEYEPLSDAQRYPVTAWLRKDAIGEGTPQALVRVTDPMGHATEYAYTEGKADFTFDDTRSHSTNVYLLLTRARTMAQEDGTFLNERNWEYNNTNPDETNPRIWRKYFYSGYMEYFKATREYVRDRHGRIMNDTAINYYDNG
jgi:YD repeat-containing protein